MLCTARINHTQWIRFGRSDPIVKIHHLDTVKIRLLECHTAHQSTRVLSWVAARVAIPKPFRNSA